MKKKYQSFAEWIKAEYNGPFLTTDLIIEHFDGKKKGIVVIDRKYEPYGIALPGGVAEHMTLEANGVKEGNEETGLEIIIDQPERPLCIPSALDRDPRAHIASAAFTAKGYGKLKPRADEDAKAAMLFTLDELYDSLETKDWAFKDHKRVVRMYLEHIGYKPKRKRELGVAGLIARFKPLHNGGALMPGDDVCLKRESVLSALNLLE